MEKTPKVFAVVTIIVCLFLACMVFISGSNILYNKNLSDNKSGGFFAPFPAIEDTVPEMPITVPHKCAPYLFDTNIYSAYITELPYTVFISKTLVYEPFSKRHILKIRTGDSPETAPRPGDRPRSTVRLKENTRLQIFGLPAACKTPGAAPQAATFYRLVSPEGKILWEHCDFGQERQPVYDVKRLTNDNWLVVTDTAPNALYVNTREGITMAYEALPKAGKAPNIRYLRCRNAAILDDDTLAFECDGNIKLRLKIHLTAEDARKNLTDRHDMNRQTVWWNGVEYDAGDIFPGGSGFFGKARIRDTLSWNAVIERQ